MATVNDQYEGALRLVHRGGAVRKVRFAEWRYPKESRQRAQFYIALGKQAGKVACSMSNGWCARPCDDWHLHPDDQDALLIWAAETQDRVITKTPRSTGPKRRGKKPPKIHPRQQGLF